MKESQVKVITKVDEALARILLLETLDEKHTHLKRLTRELDDYIKINYGNI